MRDKDAEKEKKNLGCGSGLMHLLTLQLLQKFHKVPPGKSVKLEMYL